MSRRPRIAVTGAARHGRPMILLNMFAVWRAGGCPVRLKPGDEMPDGLDGALIGGGDDIEPRLYAPELGMEIHPTVGAKVRVDPERDELEMRVLDHAAERDLPVMGICRGAQMINVWSGGGLIQDIYTMFTDLPEIRTLFPRKRVRIYPGTRLRDILGADEAKVNAMHHQAVDGLGRDIRRAAEDYHSVTQAIEAGAGRLMIGVQWHPEFLIFDRNQQALFRALVKAARQHRERAAAEPPAANGVS